MKTAVIVDSVRTGLAKSHRGGFNMTRPDDMLAHIINGMLDRNPNLPPEVVEDVIMGCGNPEGAMGHNIGRNAAVLSNLPLSVGGTTVNRYCSSGLQTVAMAATQVQSGFYDSGHLPKVVGTDLPKSGEASKFPYVFMTQGCRKV